MNISTTEELKEVLQDIGSDDYNILDVLFYPSDPIKDIKKDMIVVIFTWKCFGVSYEIYTASTVDDILNRFQKDSDKKRLSCNKSEVSSKSLLNT